MLTATEQFAPSARDPQVREFTGAVRQMQSDLAKLTASERVAQAGFTSIEDSAIIVFDALGQARMSLGKQDDGTQALVYVDGPPPPKPNPPIVAARQLGVFVAIDGTFAGGYTRPADLARFDIHMSTKSGFTPDGTTIVGDVTEAGGRLIGAANVTQYVKVVAVSRAKDSTTGAVIASPPTDQIAVLPLPISQLAAGAVGAQQFAADIGFVSRLLVGNPNAGHVELEGRTGMSPGLFAYDNGLSPTFELDGLTGSITMRGTLRSADEGERLIWREYSWANDIRFYPSTGSNYASMFARTNSINGVDYGSISFFGSTYNSRRSVVWAGADFLSMYRSLAATNAFLAGFSVDDSRVRMAWDSPSGGSFYASSSVAYMAFGGGTTIYAYPSEIYAYVNGSSYLDILSGGYTILRAGSSRFQFSTVGSGAMLWALNTNCGIQMNTTGIDIYDPSTGNYLYIGAVDISKKTSSRETKTEIEELPFDPERAIVNAPSQQYEYLRDQRDKRGRYRKARKQIGPMAEDMPAQLVSAPDDNGDVGLFMFNTIGVLWAASASQTRRLDGHDARLDDLARRLNAMGAA